MKIIIGTANLFQKYGINNKSISNKELNHIKNLKKAKSINSLDCSVEYGNLSRIKKLYNNKFNLFIKFKTDNKKKEINIQNTIKKINKLILNIDKIYCLMFHDINDLKFKNSKLIYEYILKLKKKRKVSKIGISIYQPNELNYIKKNYFFDYIQVPVNLINQSFNFRNTKFLRMKGTRFLARSILLQGAIFNNKFLAKNNILLKKITDLKQNYNENIKQVFLDYVKKQSWLDGIVIGVDNIEQFKEIINILSSKKKILFNSKKFKITKKKIIDPRTWK
jgi:diketogulonate reductase-like aldo/keto reductase